MEEEPDLLKIDQQLYLSKPGYGICYITGKYLIENVIKDVAKKNEK